MRNVSYTRGCLPPSIQLAPISMTGWVIKDGVVVVVVVATVGSYAIV